MVQSFQSIEHEMTFLFLPLQLDWPFRRVGRRGARVSASGRASGGPVGLIVLVAKRAGVEPLELFGSVALLNLDANILQHVARAIADGELRQRDVEVDVKNCGACGGRSSP